MVLSDTHTHLYLEEFDADRDAVMERAMAAGVRYFFLPDICRDTTPQLMALVNRYPDHCFPMTGLHPCYVKEGFEDELKHVESRIRSGTCCAVGEIGMDLYWDKSTRTIQEIAFRTQVEWAIAARLPFVVHCRESIDVVLDILSSYGSRENHGIMHCFTGTAEQAAQAVDLGMALGIGGVVTFKNAGLDKILEKLPLESIVLETDAPYLAPVPWRGKRNESSYLLHIIAKVAEVKSIPVQEVAEITTRNARNIFGI